MKKIYQILFTCFIILLLAPTLDARKVMGNGKAAIFSSPGKNFIIKRIADISRRNGRIDFTDGSRARFTNIWMINYANTAWNFPQEKKILSTKTDTIILRNGTVIHDLIVDYSERRHVFEFKNRRAIHWSKIARIYIAQRVKFR